MAAKFVCVGGHLVMRHSAATLTILKLRGLEFDGRGICRHGRFVRFKPDAGNKLAGTTHPAVHAWMTRVMLVAPILGARHTIPFVGELADRVEWVAENTRGEWGLDFESDGRWVNMDLLNLGIISFVFAEHADYIAFRLRWLDLD